MPNDSNAAAWNAASQNIGQAAGIYAQGKLNKKTRQWNEEIMQLQRKWALQDWNMQNEYNSPFQQMERLKAAGLNPSLIYGHGSVDNNAGGIRNSPAGQWNPKVPDIPPMASPITAYLDVEMKKQSLENMKAQNENIRAQTELTNSNTKNRDFDYDFKEATKDLRVLTMESNKARTEASTNFTADENARKWDLFNKALRQIDQDFETGKLKQEQIQESIRNIEQATKNLATENQLKQFEIKLNSSGVSKSDPAYLRLMLQVAENVFGYSPTK